MTSVTLDKLWINLVSTGAAISAYSNDRGGAFTNIGEIKQMAGGRQRAVSVVGEAGTYSFTLVDVPVADVDTLRLWKGQTVQVRNNRGQLFIGTFFSVPLGEVPDRLTSYNVSLTLQVVSVVQEEV